MQHNFHYVANCKEAMRLTYSYTLKLYHNLCIMSSFLYKNAKILFKTLFKNFGEVCVKNNQSIYWGFHADIEKDSFVNRPLLMGFLDKDFSPPFQAEFDPIFTVRCIAYNIIDGDESKYDLKQIYDKWKRMPKRKTVKNEPYFESNPWNVGDVYAYKLHSRQAEELGLNGKYLVIHKIGDEEIMGWGILSRVVVYDGIFDKLPTIQDIQHLRVLPFYDPNHYIASFENVQILRNISIMLCRYKKSHYNEKDYTFIGNIVVNEEYSYGKEYAEIYYWPIEVEHWLKFKSLWETFNYRFENGVYIVEQK